MFVPTSSAVIYLPPKPSTNLPKDLNNFQFYLLGSPIITALPPPKFNPAIEAL